MIGRALQLTLNANCILEKILKKIKVGGQDKNRKYVS